MKTKTRYGKSAYGATEVSSGRCEWGLKHNRRRLKHYTVSSLCIGVAIDNHDEDTRFWESITGGSGYAYSVSVFFAVSFFYLILKKIANDFLFTDDWKLVYTE